MKTSQINIDFQKLDMYSYQAHDNWNKLLTKQIINVQDKASQHFLNGLSKISGFIDDIPQIEQISQFLFNETGWKLIPVFGLLEPDTYFGLLSKRYFPVASYVRSDTNYTFSPIPDLWHDIFGHIPLLFNFIYSDYIQYLGSQYSLRTNFQESIARIYWYTVEAGVCQENGKCRVYGASQLSSIQEIEFALSDSITVDFFDLEKVINCPVKIDILQAHIFEIPCLEYLKVIQNQIEVYLQKPGYCLW